MKRTLLIALLALGAFATLGGVASAGTISDPGDNNMFIDEFDIGEDDGRTDDEFDDEFIVLNSSNQPAETGPRALFLLESNCDSALELVAVFVGDQDGDVENPDTIADGGLIDDCTGEDQVSLVVVQRAQGFDTFNSEERLFVEGAAGGRTGNALLDVTADDGDNDDSRDLDPFDPEDDTEF